MGYENIDKYGHCVLCHRNLTIERIVDGKPTVMFLPDKQETDFLLDDGSRMRVCICKQCKEGKDLLDSKVHDQVMEAVINGWRLEVDSLVNDPARADWTPEKGSKHMEIYSKKKILWHTASMSEHVVTDQVKKMNRMLEESKG